MARDSLWVAALALLTGVGGWSLVSAQNVSAQAVLRTEPVALPSFADLLAGPRSPTEGESCCSDADRTVYERSRTDARFGSPATRELGKPEVARSAQAKNRELNAASQPVTADR